jgi:AraC family transcriptional regulator of adaptative response/methylated-DNA-[protein]-cysteine methyltransferase
MKPKRATAARRAARLFRDGPLSFRRPEQIVYGTGKCALGRVLVASSDRGIVAIVIREKAGQALRDLRARFPKATLLRDQKACAGPVAKVVAYIAGPFERFDLPLDMRGTELQKKVWREVQKIPCGRTSTYSKIAQAVGAPKAIRAVASSCTRCWFAFAVPCHRVLHSAGANPARDGRRYRWLAYEMRLKRGMQ